MGSSWNEFCDCGKLEANPDIAGIGVLISFITSASLANISTVVYLLITRSGRVADGSFHPPGLPPPKSLNPIDGLMRSTFCVPFVEFLIKSKWVEPRMEKFNAMLYSFILSLADMQLAMGIAMLLVAIFQLHSKEITAYHFSMVTELAWLSSNVHLLALSAIRTKAVGSMKKGRRWVRPLQNDAAWVQRAWSEIAFSADIWGRVLAMFLLAALLLYGVFVTGADGWYENLECPAHCGKELKREVTVPNDMALNIALFLMAYLPNSLLLWPGLGRWWIDKGRQRVLDNRGLDSSQANQQLPPWKRALITLYYLAFSETAQTLLGGVFWFGWGVGWLFDLRAFGHSENNADVADEENKLNGFGQLVPILLLGVPISQAVQQYCEMSRAEQRKKQESQARVQSIIDTVDQFDQIDQIDQDPEMGYVMPRRTY